MTDAVSRKVARGEPFEIEYRIIPKDGSTRWVLEKGKAVYDEDRSPLWLDGVILDLNEAVEGMLKMLRRLIGENIHLAWRPGTTAAIVKIDPTQIEQLLTNMCVNAKDAIKDTGIVEQNNGFINVYSEPGQGTTFRNYLRRHLQAVPVPAPKKRAGAAGGPRS